jgi:hypothetical protein
LEGEMKNQKYQIGDQFILPDGGIGEIYHITINYQSYGYQYNLKRILAGRLERVIRIFIGQDIFSKKELDALDRVFPTEETKHPYRERGQLLYIAA